MARDKETYNTYMKKYMQERYNETRTKLIELLGGKCVDCNATENLEFDHINRETKIFTISGSEWSRNFDELKLEAQKCQLLCKKCHLLKTKRENGELTHGTLAGFWREKRKGLKPCEECLTAKKQYNKTWKKTK